MDQTRAPCLILVESRRVAEQMDCRLAQAYMVDSNASGPVYVESVGGGYAASWAFEDQCCTGGSKSRRHAATDPRVGLAP